MTTVTLVTMSPEELQSMVTQAVKAALLLVENRQQQSVLSVPDIARDSGFSKDTVRRWIQEGRSLPGGRRVKLKVIDGLSSDHRVRWESYRAFLAEFPDIAVVSKKPVARPMDSKH